MRFIPAVSLVRIQLPLPLRPGGQAVKTPPFHGGNTSSILVRVTIFGRIAQLVRALASHARGQRFESVYAHQKENHPKRGGFSFSTKKRTRTAGSISFRPESAKRDWSAELMHASAVRESLSVYAHQKENHPKRGGFSFLFFAFRFFFEFEAEHRNIVKLRGFPDERVDIRFDRRQQVGGGGVGVFR